MLDLAHQALDLVFVQQQLFGANRVRPHMGGGCAQGVDLAADDEHFTITDNHVAVSELHLAFAHRFDLPAFKHHAGFKTLFNVVIEVGFFVVRNAYGSGRRFGRQLGFGLGRFAARCRSGFFRGASFFGGHGK